MDINLKNTVCRKHILILEYHGNSNILDWFRLRTLGLRARGTDVMEIQSLLKKIGYNPGPVDGTFGTQMELAVKTFQRNNGLAPDGVIGPIITIYLINFWGVTMSI